jgi:cytochrome P450
VIAGNGEKWKNQRKFSLKVMRHLGMGKQEVEDGMVTDIEDLIRDIKEQPAGMATDMYRVMGSCAASTITHLITGKKFPMDHPIRRQIDECFLSRGDGTLRPTALGVIAMMPAISKFLCSLPGSPAQGHRNKMDKIHGFLKQQLELLKDRTVFDPETDAIDCFMKAYVKEMPENKDGQFFTDENAIGCAFAFFFGGAESLGDVLTWFFLYLMLYPDVQERMRNEIDDVIGPHKRISYNYRDAMPYTQAVIQELHRIVTAFPIGLSHATAKDVTLGEWLIPKGTHILLGVHDVHMNEEYFPNPDKFDPSRFIDEEGRFIRSDKMIAFSTGKRSCPGQPVADCITFLYLVAFVREFTIRIPDGVTYTTDSDMEFVGHAPKQFPIKAVFSERSDI